MEEDEESDELDITIRRRSKRDDEGFNDNEQSFDDDDNKDFSDVTADVDVDDYDNKIEESDLPSTVPWEAMTSQLAFSRLDLQARAFRSPDSFVEEVKKCNHSFFGL